MLILLPLCLLSGWDTLEGPERTRDATPEHYRDVLKAHFTPRGPHDRVPYLLLDQGSWFGFALPDPSVTACSGGFSGPFLLQLNRWLCPCLLAVEINNRPLPSTALVAQHLYPGWLERVYQLDSLQVRAQLFFIAPDTAYYRLHITSRTGRATGPIALQLVGRLFEEARPVRVAPTILRIVTGTSETDFILHIDPALSFEQPEAHHFVGSGTLSPDFEAVEVGVLLTLQAREAAAAPDRADRLLQQGAALFQQQRMRWERYLSRLFEAPSPWLDTLRYRRLAVKALLTLVANWRHPWGDLRHAGLFPSFAVPYFHGFWAWDSWKHAVALAVFAPELAKDQILAMYDYQLPDGMIPDVIYAGADSNNYRNTKPPLSGWAIWTVYERTGDQDFLATLYPRLKAYHAWWYAHRDDDGDSLCAYGSTDGTLIAAKWESGMDNAIRFDQARIRQYAGGWVLNQESVDLNAYLYAEKLWLARMAEELGRKPDAERFRQEAARLRQHVLRMYHARDRYFYDMSTDGKNWVRVRGPEGWTPLWVGLASSAQARGVVWYLTDPEVFATHVPFPTVAADHPAFDPTGYWRGAVWVDQVYFALMGMKRYGFLPQARRLFYQFLHHAEGLLESAPIYENYHPLTGQGLEAPHFSWSAAHLLLLLREL